MISHDKESMTKNSLAVLGVLLHTPCHFGALMKDCRVKIQLSSMNDANKAYFVGFKSIQIAEVSPRKENGRLANKVRYDDFFGKSLRARKVPHIVPTLVVKAI